MKILITGGTGRVGANLAQALLDKGHEIRSFVYPGDQSRAHKLDGFDRVETIEGDLRSLADVRRAVEGVDAVYHIAAAFGGPFDNREYLEINGMGTINVLESIRELTPNLHRLVYASTEAIYWSNPYNGRCFEEPIREDQVARYQTMPYFLTKWIGEELVMSYNLQFGLPSVTTRFATIIEPGEFLDENGLPNMFLLGPVYERFKDQEGAEELKALWTGEEAVLAITESRRAALSAGVCRRARHRPRAGTGAGAGTRPWARCSTWVGPRCSIGVPPSPISPSASGWGSSRRGGRIGITSS